MSFTIGMCARKVCVLVLGNSTDSRHQLITVLMKVRIIIGNTVHNQSVLIIETQNEN